MYSLVKRSLLALGVTASSTETLDAAKAYAEGLADLDVLAQPGATFADKWDYSIALLSALGGGRMKIRGNQTLTLTRKIRFPVGYISYDLGGATIDASPITSGYAVEVIPAEFDYKTGVLQLGGLRLIGATSESNPTDGIFFGRPDDLDYGNIARLQVAGLHVEGFRDNLTFGPHAWLIGFDQYTIKKAWRRGAGFGTGAEGSYNAGEQINFWHGVFDGNRNAAGNAVCVETALGYAGSITFGATAFDYSDIDGIIRAGVVTILAPHGENNCPQPNFKRVYTDAQAHPPEIKLIGGCVGNYWARLSGDTEPAGGKDCYIDNVGAGPGGISLSNLRWNSYDRSNTELVRSDSDIPLQTTGLIPVVQANATPYLSKRLSATKDPLFQVNPIVAWLGPMQNQIANGSMDPGSGTPTGFAVAGSVSGVTQTLSVDYTAGRPRLKVVLSGTPAANGTVGVYLAPNNAVVTAEGQSWIGSAYVQFETKTGIISVQTNMVDRTSGGASAGGATTTFAVSRARKRLVSSARTSVATAAYIHYAVQAEVSNGVAVTATYYIDTPALYQSHIVYEDAVYDTQSGASLPTLRSLRSASDGVSGSACLVITNTGSGNGGRYQDIGIRPGERLWCRGMFKGTISSGSYGLRVEFMSSDSTVLETRDYGDLLTTSQASYVQRGDIRHAPEGTTKARVWAWTTALNGTVYCDELYAWVLQ